jgi:hypothetical protein
VPEVEVIAQLRGVMRLTGEKSSDVLGAALLGRAMAPADLLRVGVGDRDDDAVQQRSLGSQGALQGASRHIVGLPQQVVAEQCVPGDVAAQHGVEADPVAGGKAGLGGELGGERATARLLTFEHPNRLTKRDADRLFQALQILAVPRPARILDHVHAGQDGRLDLPAAGLKAS